MLKEKFCYEGSTSILDQVESLNFNKLDHTSFLTPQDRAYIGKTNVLEMSRGTGFVGPNTALFFIVDKLLKQ